MVEAISNCHVNLGRKNKMKSALTMTKWIAEKTVGKEEHAKLKPEEKEHKYPVGILQADHLAVISSIPSDLTERPGDLR